MRPSFPSRLSHFPWLLRNFQRCLNIVKFLHVLRTSLVAQMVNCLSTMRETWVQSTPVLLSWKSHGRRSLVQATVHGVAKSQAWLSDFTFFLSFIFHVLKAMRKKHSSFHIRQLPNNHIWKKKSICCYQKNWELVSLITSIACHSALQKFNFSSPGRCSRRKTFLCR